MYHILIWYADDAHRHRMLREYFAHHGPQTSVSAVLFDRDDAPCLTGCQAHCTAILSDSDSQIFHDLGIDATSEPEFSSNNLYLG